MTDQFQHRLETHRTVIEFLAIGSLVLIIAALLGFIFFQRSAADERLRQFQEGLSQCFDAIQTAKESKP